MICVKIVQALCIKGFIAVAPPFCDLMAINSGAFLYGVSRVNINENRGYTLTEYVVVRSDIRSR